VSPAPKLALAATAFAAALVAAWPASVGHATVATAKKKPASELREPMIRQMIVKLRNPKAAELTKPLGAERVAALSAAASVRMSAVRPMSGNASVLRLERAMTITEAKAVASRLAEDPNVEYADPDLPVYAMQVLPQDVGYAARLWHYYPPTQTFTANNKSIVAIGGANLQNAWNLPGASTTLKGSRKVVIALIDTGVVLSHPELAGTLLQGYDFVSSDVGASSGVPTNFVANDGDGRDPDASDPGDWVTSQDIESLPNFCDPPASDSSWHGAHMAGTIVGVWNNGVGASPPAGTSTAGMAPNVRILPLRALGKCGGSSSDVIDAMRFAVGITVPGAGGPIVNLTPAQILNMSLGAAAGTCLTSYQQAVDDVVARGALVVAAAGNDALQGLSQPASCNGVLAVTAHTIDGDNADYANVGTAVGISAPGGGQPVQLPTTSTSSDNAWYTWSSILFGAFGPDSAGSPPNQDKSGPAVGGFTGTSSATAHASAVAALVKSIVRTASPGDVRNFIVNNRRPHPAGGYCAPGQLGAGTCGSGLLDASLAVAAAAASVPGGPPPLADAGPDRTVAPGTAVTLDAGGSVAFNGKSITSYAWRQINNGATQVALSGPSSPLAGFTAPAAGQTLVFELTVTDSSTPTPKSDTIDVAITVQSPPAPPSGGGGGSLPPWQLLLLATFAFAARIRSRA
jgi:serine protease